MFKVTAIESKNGFSDDELMEHVAHAESFSNHPIALSILKAYAGIVDKERLSRYDEIAGHGISVQLDGKEILVGNEKLMN